MKPQVTEAVPVIAGESPASFIKSYNLEYGFDRMFRRQFYGKKTKISNAYPNFWLLFLGDMPSGQTIRIKYKHRIFEMSGRCAAYIPMGVLVEWEVPGGWHEWVSYVSTHEAPEDFPTMPAVFHFSDYPDVSGQSDLLNFMRDHFQKREDEGIEGTRRSANDLERVLDYIKEHYRAIDRVEEVGRILNIPYSTMTHQFTHIYGVSPIVYMNMLRIFGILLEICAGEQATHIFQKYGYKNYPTFYRQFKKVIGCSPSVFARRGFSSVDSVVDLKTIRQENQQKM